MIKRLLSIITSVSVAASALTYCAYAAPTVAGTFDTGMEYIPEIVMPEDEKETELFSGGPAPVTVADSAQELNTEFGTPEHWDGAMLMADLEGEGTEQSPYLIGSADELKLMAENVNSGSGANAYYKLTADIDLGGSEWTPIGFNNAEALDPYSTTFSGVFDGDGHTVSNLTITKDGTAYIGFFGFVNGGTVKNFNIDNAVITLDSGSSQKLYTGVLVGRLVTTENNLEASITNCNVTNSSITAKSKGTIYAGGIAASVITGAYDNSNVFIAFTHSECNIDIYSSANNYFDNALTGKREPHMVIAGGITGYLSSQSGTNISITNSSAKGDISTDASSSSYAQAMTGGLFGDVRAVDGTKYGGEMNISSCYSEGTVSCQSYFYPYVIGGFAGQIYATKGLYINDCYSSSDVSGEYGQVGKKLYDILLGGYVEYDPSAGGFVGQLFFPDYITSYGQTITNCYGAGDVVDLTHTETSAKDTTFVGGFTAWADAGVFENCYRLEEQRVWGSDCNSTDYNVIKCLSAEESKYVDAYIGFDMENVWQMNPEAEYCYPTLREKLGYVNFVSDGSIFATTVFGTNGKVTAPAETPVKASTVDKVFTFSYWSLSEDGTAFNFGGDTVSRNTTLYAVYKSEPRSYNIRFLVDGYNFVETQKVVYGNTVDLPQSTPTKSDTDKFYYEFLHWSDIGGGEAFDFTNYKVESDKDFYAVFEEIDKSAWKGEIAEEFESGLGTESHPYIISNGEQLALLAKVINEKQAGYTEAYYALGDNINLGKAVWVPIGSSIETPFSAHFDGRGFSISSFRVANTQHTGLFGVIHNGTVKDISVSNFIVNLSPVSTDKEYHYYIGGVVGLISSLDGESTVSGIRVSAAEFNVNASVAGRVYVGNIAGFVTSSKSGDSIISNCFATTGIKLNNPSGYAYVGGIAGRMDTYNGSISLVDRCYNIGSLESSSYNSSYVGGLVAYLFSNGSAYTSSDDESAELAADDVDVMVSNSFAIANVSAASIRYNTYIGKLVGSYNQHADCKNVYYPRGTAVTVNPSEEQCIIGAAQTVDRFKDKDALTKDCLFDFENTWTFVAGYQYPVLKKLVSGKPVLTLVDAGKSDGTVNASIQVLFDDSDFTLIIGVYNARNQLIKLERKYFEKSEYLIDVEVSYENLKAADYIAVSAVETSSLKPLFPGVSMDI